MVGNPTDAGDTDSIPGPERVHMLRIPHAVHMLSPCTTTTEPMSLEAHALQQEKPPNERPAQQLKCGPRSLQLEKAHVQ